MDHTSRPDKICPSCQQNIKFIKMEKSGRFMPVDAALFVAKVDDPEMSLVQTDGTMKRGVKVGEVGYVSHFSTCSEPDRFRK